MSVLLIRYSEIGLKGKNRKFFIQQLASNIRKSLVPFAVKLQTEFHQIRIDISNPKHKKEVLARLQAIPGVAIVLPVSVFPRELDSVSQFICNQFKILTTNSSHQSFRIDVRRKDKFFPLTSPEIEAQIGHDVCNQFPNLKVQLKQADIEVYVDVQHDSIFVYLEKISGMGGLPVSSKNRVVTLLSGGIDSPVASWKMTKRGCYSIALYFHSFLFVGHQTKQKVIDLAKILAIPQQGMKLYIAPFTEFQKALQLNTPERLKTLLYRRQMHRIADQIAWHEKASTIITGDAISQVASETLRNIATITEASQYPILRPLVGMDKQEIINEARSIGTYQISIQDDPDCCTVFQPRYPATGSYSSLLRKIETKLDLENFTNESLEQCEVLFFSEQGELQKTEMLQITKDK